MAVAVAVGVLVGVAVAVAVFVAVAVRVPVAVAVEVKVAFGVDVAVLVKPGFKVAVGVNGTKTSVRVGVLVDDFVVLNTTRVEVGSGAGVLVIRTRVGTTAPSVKKKPIQTGGV